MTTTKIMASKSKEKLVVITAYDALIANLIRDYADIILVGDSLSMSFGGENDTLGITLDQMIYHTQAVVRGAKESFVVMDMPFGSVTTTDQALANAVRVYKETGASAVKIEGGAEKAELIRNLVENGIAVMGHIGLMPQFVRNAGGYKVRGKDSADQARLIEDAKALEKAGVFSIVIEGVRSETARLITEAVNVPTIGIGAGVNTDGQVLVWSDMLGVFEGFKPKFVRRYMEGSGLIRSAFESFANDVKSGEFPSSDEEY